MQANKKKARAHAEAEQDFKSGVELISEAPRERAEIPQEEEERAMSDDLKVVP